MNCDSVILVKESLCELEADAVATDILNRLSVSGNIFVYVLDILFITFSLLSELCSQKINEFPIIRNIFK